MAEPETVLVEQKAPLLVRVLGLTVVLMLAGALLVWGWDLGGRLIGASSKPAPPVVIEHAPPAGAAAVPAASAPAASAGQDSGAAAAAENDRLSADLALLESILPPVKPGAGLLVRGLQARMASPAQLHYTVLLGYGAKKSQPSFEGQLKLILRAEKDGKPLTLEFPTSEGVERYKLTVDDYQRIDGTLDLPAGVAPKSLQVTLSGNKTSITETTPVKTGP